MAIEDYTPTADEVAATHLRNRTVTPGGQELGVFSPADGPDSDRTKPTKEQAEAIINEVAQDDVSAMIGTLDDGDGPEECITNLRNSAKRLVALGAAMQIELTFFSEQVAQGRSPYDKFKELYDDRAKTLREAVAECTGGGSGDPGESVGGGGQFPSYNFPDDPVIGRETRW